MLVQLLMLLKNLLIQLRLGPVEMARAMVSIGVIFEV